MVKHTIKSVNQVPQANAVGLAFYLSITDDGEVELNATGPEGEEWIILKIANNGKLSLAAYIGSSLGLEVDDEGAIEINEDTY